MSYCRFSDDRQTCDVYAYQDIEMNYTVHIAENRFRWWWRMLRLLTDKKIAVGSHTHYVERRLVAWLSWKLPYWVRTRKIRKPLAGCSLHFETENEMFGCFKFLASKGYHVPEYLLK